jgi:hypothetical protein
MVPVTSGGFDGASRLASASAAVQPLRSQLPAQPLAARGASRLASASSTTAFNESPPIARRLGFDAHVSPEGALLPKPYAAAAVSDAQLISELGGAVGTDHAATSPAAAAAGSSVATSGMDHVCPYAVPTDAVRVRHALPSTLLVLPGGAGMSSRFAVKVVSVEVIRTR